ncbi:GMC family oxidoreductase [Nocardia transvalensis]|uniref:GMC family oxidoreductase n=1 Tax=Nocardia transvalensis TaxID=37333 RepID=UPI001E3A99D8|nr:GMC family oxidoreductase N-terminal domain-containing protein [Nocardia transvalensis]
MQTRFDYIVIGAGTAGCVLAARLSQDSAARVLLLESGPPDTLPAIARPSAFPGGLLGSEVDYAYETVPQPGLAGRTVPWPRGRTLGGSSSINAMIYLRGHPNDYDRWAESGCVGWDFESVLPYFRRMETAAGRDRRFRGDSGPMLPAPAAPPNPVAQAFLDAAAATGYRLSDDLNGAHPEGAGWNDLAITGERRQSTADAYLRPLLGHRRNLTVVTNACAHRLVFDRTRCVGVEFERDGRPETAYADAEVIVSAGAVDSPRLLLLSGVGPASSWNRPESPWSMTYPESEPTCTITHSASWCARPVDPYPCRARRAACPRRRSRGAATQGCRARTCRR